MSLRDTRISNLSEIEEGVWTAGQPSQAQLEQAAGAGLKTVINLCMPGECGWDEAEVVEKLGLSYHSLPISGGADLGKQAAHTLHEYLESGERPLLVHCGSSNRVGALFALKALHVHGHEPEQALAHGRTAGLTGLEAVVRQLLHEDV